MVDFDHAFIDPQNSPPATGLYKDLWHYPEDGDSVEQHVHRRIAELTRDNPHKFWVGVCAGELVGGCRTRWNKKYRDDEMTRIEIIYKVNSKCWVKDLEYDLIKYYRDNVKNKIGDEDENIGNEPPYCVYIAWRED